MSNDRKTGVIIPFQQNAEFYYQRGNRYLTENEDLVRAEQYLRNADQAMYDEKQSSNERRE